MTELRPRGADAERWTEAQIREAMARGEFDDLPLKGRPIPGLGQPDDDHWWIRAKLEREDLATMPPSLALRRDVLAAIAGLDEWQTEAEVRRAITEVNAKIRQANRVAISGPPVTLVVYDEEELVDAWRGKHPQPATPIVPDATGSVVPPRRIGGRALDRFSGWTRRHGRRTSTWRSPGPGS